MAKKSATAALICSIVKGIIAILHLSV
jgi:hypothetical protein